MTRLFIHLARYFSSHRTICWLSMTLCFVLFGYLAAQIHLEEDINKLMPSSKNDDGTTKLAFADLKIKDKVFVTFEGTDVDSLVTVCDDFVDSLLADSMASQGIGDIFYQLPDDLMPEGIGYISEHLPAYIDTSAYAAFDTLLTRPHFERQMQQNRDDLMSEVGELFPELIQMDPMGMRQVLAHQLAPVLQGGTGSYQTLDNHFFVPDSTVCVAFITPRYSSTNTGQGSAMFESMNKHIDHFQALHSSVRISYHGTPASGFYNASQIKHDLTTTVALAMLAVLIFLLVCFRRWTVIPLLLLPVAFGTLFSLSIMYLVRGEFSLLALGIGAVVLGVAFSYVLHVLTHQQYVGNRELMLQEQVKPVLLGCITTIGSFSALIFIQTDLLRDFGLFAAFAILGTTVFSLVWLPQMLDNHQPKRFPAFIDRINTYPFDRQRPLLVVIVILIVICSGAYLLRGIRFDADMHNLGYDHPLVLHSENVLRDKTYTGDKTKYFASQGRSMEEAIENFALLEQELDSLQQLGLVKGYTPTNMLFVPLRQQQERIDAWHRYWTPERLALVRRLISETAPAADLEPDAFETFFQQATADYEPDALYKAGIIPEGYQSTLTEQSYGGDYLVFTSVRCQNDSVRSSQSDYIRICDAIARHPHLLVLDTYYYTTDTLLEMSHDFDVLQWLSMAFVLVVLWLSFHFNLRHTLLAFAPILLSWVIVLGVMDLFGVQFNLISIIISTFIFGIGVDYSIFIMNGLTAPDQQTLHYHKTAILLSAVVLITTVSSMLLAVHPAIRSVGFSTLVGLLAAIVLSYVLQPAIYRWLNQRQRS